MEKGEILIYQYQEGNIKIDVRLKDETVWLTQEQMAELFQRDKSTISRHIKNIFAEGELDEKVVVAEFATTTFLINLPSLNIFFICLEMVDLSR